MDARTVVSLIGEAWSPNIAPEIVAPSINGTGMPSVIAIGTAIGIMIANVPQLEPTENAINADTRNTRGARRTGAILPLTRLATYTPVPSAFATSPSASANSKMIAIGNMPPAPFIKTCISSLTELLPLIRVMVQATAIAKHTDQSTATEPDPLMMLPSPVM